MGNTTNPELKKIIRFLRVKARKHNAPIWKTLAEKLEKSKHRRNIVNLSTINRYTDEGETVTVAGKVLGAGTLEHRVSVAAFSFSEEAKRKIEGVKGECLTLSNLVKKNPEGINLKIIG